jgi:hypothetical protein
MFVLFERKVSHCPYRTMVDAVEIPVVIKRRIPPQGICALSYDRQQPCAYFDDEDHCPDLANLDFCNDRWAKEQGD